MHEVSHPIFWEKNKKNITSLSSSETVYKRDTFFDFNLFSCTPRPFSKGSALEGKNLLPNKFFSFKADPFAEERKKQYDSVASPEWYLFPLSIYSGYLLNATLQFSSGH